jgi:signal transduction histidine kinase
MEGFSRRAHDRIDPDRNTVRKAYRLQRSLEAAELLHSTLDIKQLTSIILEIIRNEVPVQRVSAFEVDRKENVVRSLIAQDVDGGPIVTEMGNGIAGHVAQTGQAADVPDAYADPKFNSKFDGLLDFRTTDILALPIRGSNGEVNGVLELLNRKHAFRQEDIEFLQEVSVFIGLAMENAAMHEELQSKARLEEEVAKSRERLLQMDRLVLVNEVLTTVLDELTVSGRVVERQTNAIKSDPAVTKNIVRDIEYIEAANARSTEAIRHFLKFAQGTDNGHAPLDMSELIRSTVAFRRAQWAIQAIEADVKVDKLPSITGSYSKIQQALIHIIKNAEDAVASRASDKRISIHGHLSHNGRHIRIDVRDNGRGIPTELYERIFEPFFSATGERGRTGLGLSIANRVVQEHEGEIVFETTPGEGSLFTIMLPT